MPKILIMVLSFNDGVYDELMKTQQQTWDSIEVEGVRTVYYHGGSPVGRPLVHTNMAEFKSWYRIELPITDSYYYMSGKFKTALEFIEKEDRNDFDIIFRTNSSSYVNKQKVKEFAATLPTEKLYSGWTMVDSEDHGGLVVSGAGIFLSRDTAEILRENIDPNFEQEEDIYCGRILRKNGIIATDDKNRYDVPSQFSEIPLDRYHYRFKTGNRLRDCENMKQVHKLITQ